MNIAAKHIVAALAGSLALIALSAPYASANYLGLADGNPGPADTWAAIHPEFGRVMHSRNARTEGDCEHLRQAALDTGSRRMWQRYRACETE